MNKDFLSKLNHDLSFRPGIIREALEKGVQFGTKEFFVYSQLRWYETDGKFGFCVAGNERLGEDVGMTATEIKNTLNRLKDAGLVEHVWCDKRVYRNKTKLWISTVRLAGVCTNVDAIRVLKDGAKNTAMLAETVCGETETVCGETETVCGETETVCGETVASSVITGVGNTNRNININNPSSQPSAARKVPSKKETKVKVLNPSLSNLYRIIEIEEPKNQIEIKRVNKLYGIAKHSYSDEQLIEAANNIAKKDKKYRSINSLLVKTNENLNKEEKNNGYKFNF